MALVAVASRSAGGGFLAVDLAFFGASIVKIQRGGELGGRIEL